MKNRIIIPIIIIILILAAGVIFYQYWWLPKEEVREPEEVAPTEEIPVSEEELPEEEIPEETIEESTGFIEGSLSNPSEFIPEDMVICAENTDTKKLYCTEEHIKDDKYTYKIGYKIEVPAGDYFVYAYLPEDKDYKAYYSEFVTCGFSVNCPSHKPIKVTVQANQTESNIDPQDWYNF